MNSARNSTSSSRSYVSGLNKETLAFVADHLLDNKNPLYQPKKIKIYAHGRQLPYLSEECLMLPSLQVPNFPDTYLKEVADYKASLLETPRDASESTRANKDDRVTSFSLKLKTRNKSVSLRTDKSLKSLAITTQRQSPAKFKNERLRYIGGNDEYQKELAFRISRQLSTKHAGQQISRRRQSAQGNSFQTNRTSQTHRILLREMRLRAQKLEELKTQAKAAERCGYDSVNKEWAELIRLKSLKPAQYCLACNICRIVSSTKIFKAKLDECRSKSRAERKVHLIVLPDRKVDLPVDTVLSLKNVCNDIR